MNNANVTATAESAELARAVTALVEEVVSLRSEASSLRLELASVREQLALQAELAAEREAVLRAQLLEIAEVLRIV